MITCVIQARMGSSRLPGKVMMNLAGKPLLQWVIEVAMQVKKIDDIVVATTLDPDNDKIANFCKNKVDCFRYMEENDVLSRFYYSTKGSDHVVRFTADCPLIQPELVDSVIYHHLTGGFDFTHSERAEGGWPNGLGAEIMTRRALLRAFTEATSKYDLEHVTPYFYNNPDKFKVGFFRCANPLPIKYSIDTKEEFDFVERILKEKNYDPNLFYRRYRG